MGEYGDYGDMGGGYGDYGDDMGGGYGTPPSDEFGNPMEPGCHGVITGSLAIWVDYGY